MVKKNIIVGILLVVLFILVSCNNERYNDNMYNAEILTTGFSFKHEFLKDNLTRGSHYLDEYGEIAVAEGESYPNHKFFIINSHTDIDFIFESFSTSTDFEKVMFIAYIFTSSNPNPCKIKKSFIDDDVLKINYVFQKSKNGSDNTTSPMQRYLLVKVDKLEVEKAEFING